MKQILIILLAGLLLFLSACGEQAPAAETTAATTAATTVSTETSATESTAESSPPTETEPAILPNITNSPLESLPPIAFEGVDSSTVEWNAGNRVVLWQQSEFTVYLCKASNGGSVCYDIQMDNRSDVTLRLQVPELYFNGNIRSNDSCSFYADPGQWGSMSFPLDIPLAAVVGEMDPVTQMDLYLTVSESPYRELTVTHAIHVNLSGEAVVTPYYAKTNEIAVTDPVREFFYTGQQLVTEQNGLRITVLQVGKPQFQNYLVCLLRITNTADDWRYFKCNAMQINGVQCKEGTGRMDLRPGSIVYTTLTLSVPSGIERIGAFALHLTTGIGKYSDNGPTTSGWYPVVPLTAVKDPTPFATDELLLQEQGLEVFLFASEITSTDSPQWNLIVVNNTDLDIELQLWDIGLGDELGTGSEYMSVTADNTTVFAHSSTLMTVWTYDKEPVSFRLHARDPIDNKEYFTTEGRISLELPETEK